MFANLYLRLADEQDQKINAITKEIRKRVNWKYVFLCDFNGWSENERYFSADEMMSKIDRLWKKYEDAIPEFTDESNKDKWREICDEKEPQKDDIREFLHDLIF